MSLTAAMFSGVSGLAAQSTAMATISDNISNTNTIGYKGTNAIFSTLVTESATDTTYSAGGVLVHPRGVEVGHLLGGELLPLAGEDVFTVLVEFARRDVE